ncbi:MAG: D-alanyl-D-alanine carboxypeptidase [Alphaproteobacteria bacterium]|nr:D-alanyl-D-alanine carboxypeptidase [Alphaproteobacteria bacterium]
MFNNFLKFICLVPVCLVLLSVHSYAQDTLAKQALIIDFETENVLFEKNSDEQMPTSSMSKVMTMYLVFEALKSGTIKLDDEFLVGEKAWKKQGSKMFVSVGDKVKIEDLIRGVIVQSGNDATIVLAEGLAGSEEAFAQALNEKAKELGMSSSHFMNASGWPDPEHYSTAHDLAVLAKAIIKDFPEYYKYYAEKEFTYNDITQQNRNPLIYKDIGADGVKTGHTDDGGYGLIGSGKKNDRRVIMVLNGMESEKQRKEESVRLMQWALSSFKNMTVFKTMKPLEEADVIMGQKTKVALVPAQSTIFTVPSLFRNKLNISVEYTSPLVAPLVKGDRAGEIKIVTPEGEERKIDLLIGEDVPELGFFLKIIAKARMLLQEHGG